jgi:hypothetical protein
VQRGKQKDSVRRTVTMMAHTALTRTHRTPFHSLGRTDAQYHIGDRRCRPLPAMKPNRAAVDIALSCTRATEIRAAGEVPPMRGTPPDKPPILTLLRAMLSQYSTVMEFN